MPEPRIVSLLPAATEIVAALGFEGNLVGRSHECDYPPSVEALPVCTEPKLGCDGTSYELDERVRALVQEGLAVYRVHADVLRELQPDIIITQDQCEVCAVSLAEVKGAVRDVLGGQVRLVSLSPASLEDVWGDIHRVADALGVSERADKLVGSLKNRLVSLAEQTGSTEHRPRTACLEWLDPLMGAGNWVPTLVETAGGHNLFGEADRHTAALDWEKFVEVDPEVVVAFPCGWGIEKTREEMAVLTRRPEWDGLQAVRNGRVYVADGHQYFNRPGPRLVESAEILAKILHPGRLFPL